MLILKLPGTLPPSQPTTASLTRSASCPGKGHRPDRQGTARESDQFRERCGHVDLIAVPKFGELPGHPGVAILTASRRVFASSHWPLPSRYAESSQGLRRGIAAQLRGGDRDAVRLVVVFARGAAWEASTPSFSGVFVTPLSRQESPKFSRRRSFARVLAPGA